MRIPYGELQTANVIANDENEHEHVLERVCYAFVIPCRDCKHNVIDPCAIDPGWPLMCNLFGCVLQSEDGFCKWGERRDA